MKRIIFSVLIATVALSSCNKNDLNDPKVWDYVVTTKALVRFVHSYTALTPTLATPANGPIVNFYINDVKMNATPLSYTNFYPNTSGGGAFAEAPSGNVTIKVVLNRPTGGGLPSDTIARGNFLLAPGQSHSIMLVDTLPNPTPFNPILMVVQESVSTPAYGKFRLRFLNLIATNEVYEIYNATNATVITSPILFKNFSDWVDLPASGVSQTYQLRVVGSTTAIATTTTALTNLRTYTIWARGTNPAIPVGAGVTSRARGLVTMITK